MDDKEEKEETGEQEEQEEQEEEELILVILSLISIAVDVSGDFHTRIHFNQQKSKLKTQPIRSYQPI